MIPSDALRYSFDDGRSVGATALARLALAVVTLHERHHRVTLRDLVAETGYALSTCERTVAALRELGLVDYVDHAAATLHPVVRRVA